jgi:deoxyribodipyrimidine photolyase
VPEVTWCTPGESAGRANLEAFLERRLKKFATLRNDPTQHALSDCSPVRGILIGPCHADCRLLRQIS